MANEQELSRRALYATIDAERARGDRLFAVTERLQKELDQVKLELKLERQNKFATNQQKQKSGDTADAAVDSAAASTTEKKKRGAPVGHPGWFRKTPQAYDWAVDVAAPTQCPHCGGRVNAVDAAPTEHLQEDILEGRYRVVLYRHEAARCEDCDKLVQKAGDGEILHSRIGPPLRSPFFPSNSQHAPCCWPVRCCAILSSRSYHNDHREKKVSGSAAVTPAHSRNTRDRVWSTGD